MPSAPILLTFEEARHCVEDHAAGIRPPQSELVGLLQANGRILAEPISADRDLPPFPRAARDGYAVRTADLRDLPATLTLIGEIKAGDASDLTVNQGEAVSIMTGAACPSGADAVVMVEYTAQEGVRVQIQKAVAAGDNIVPLGVEARAEQLLLDTGARLDYASIGVAATVGKSRLLVYRKPSVAVLSTGDEIVDISASPSPTQIRNSNTYSLAAQVIAAGGEPVLLPIAPDEESRLRELAAEGLQADLLLLAGGVSMGKYDLVEKVLSELNAEFFFTGAKIQPGKPVVFGRIPMQAVAGEGARAIRYFFGLPGNPVSTMVTFDLFVKPFIEALAGSTPRNFLYLHARLKSSMKAKPGLTRFLPASLSGEFDRATVEPVGWQGSGDIAAAARANCYLVVARDCEKLAAGDWVPVIPR